MAAFARRTAAPVPAPTPMPSRVSSHSSTKSSAPTAIFVTPALTTTFTPPPSCTSHHLTMLENQAFRVWMNEPIPVPDTTFSDCYPSQFMTSYQQQMSNTIVPAFSPLVCPDSYATVFNQPIKDRPLYIACCPSDFGFAPPSSSIPGRPAYGGTCFSSYMTAKVTGYNNISSTGIQVFSTSAQVYAHPIDGFAMEAATSSSTPLASGLATATTTSQTASSDSKHSSKSLNPSAKAGIAFGVLFSAVLICALLFLSLRTRSLKKQQRRLNGEAHDFGSGAKSTSSWISTEPQTPKVPPQRQNSKATHAFRDEKCLPPTPSPVMLDTRKSLLSMQARVLELDADMSWELPARQTPRLSQFQPESRMEPSELEANPRRLTASTQATSINGRVYATTLKDSETMSVKSERHWPRPPTMVATDSNSLTPSSPEPRSDSLHSLPPVYIEKRTNSPKGSPLMAMEKAPDISNDKPPVMLQKRTDVTGRIDTFSNSKNPFANPSSRTLPRESVMISPTTLSPEDARRMMDSGFGRNVSPVSPEEESPVVGKGKLWSH